MQASRISLVAVVASAALLAAVGASCQRRPGEDGLADISGTGRVVLPGIDASSLTVREQLVWSELVTELAVPCQGVDVTVARCVAEGRDCPSCVPAAELLLRQVQRGSPKKQIGEVFADRFAPDRVKTVVIGDSASKGPRDAPVTVVEFADFQCPACGVVAGLLDKVLASFAGQVRMVFKHFPWSYHQYAALAAQAAFAAQQQGQFWRMHQRLFADRRRLAEPDLLEAARSIGLDVERFRADMHSDQARARVAQELRQGESLGVVATPTVLINGRDCDLSKLGDPERELREWIRLEIDLAARRAASPPAATHPPASDPAAPVASPPPAANQPAEGP